MKLIKGVKIIKLKQIKDERGKIMHMLKIKLLKYLKNILIN